MPYYKTLENELYFLDSAEFEHTLPIGYMPVTDEDADLMQKSYEQNRLNAMTYVEKRLAAYPSFADQFDTIFHGGLDAWKAEIQAVKTQFPKEVA
jgi:hypothetical protein